MYLTTLALDRRSPRVRSVQLRQHRGGHQRVTRWPAGGAGHRNRQPLGVFSGDVVVRVQIEGELAGAIGRQDDRIVREPRSGIGCAADRRTVADGAVGPAVACDPRV